MSNNGPFPLYFKLANIAIAIFIFFYVLYIGQGIILPLVYAGVFAILLNPLVNWLCSKRINRVVSILLAVLFSLIVVCGVVYFIASQMADFSETMPQFKEKFGLLIKQCYEWFSDTFNVKTRKIDAWIEQAKAQGLDNSPALIGSTLSSIGGLLAIVFMIPVYVFMFLFYKPLLLEFIGQLFDREKHNTVVEVLLEIKMLIQRYLTGLMFEMIIIAALNVMALMIIGVDYAVLIGITGAILNIIPYIGGIVAIAIPTLVALATQSPEAAGWVVVAYLVIQLIDNNFVVPMVVASKVKLNALISIIVVLIGGAIWGIPGMFIAIPLTAIVKVIFDRMESLQAWGFLLGDTMPPIGKTIFYFRKVNTKPNSSNDDEA